MKTESEAAGRPAEVFTGRGVVCEAVVPVVVMEHQGFYQVMQLE